MTTRVHERGPGRGALAAGAGGQRRGLAGGDAVVLLAAASVLAAAMWLEVSGEHLAAPGGATLGGMCFLRELTGMICPFCGMSRSVVALVHGDLAASLGFHPGGALIVALLMASLVGAAHAALTGGRQLASRPGYWRMVEMVALVCLAAGLARYTW